jgi:hypothetical protein
MNPYRIAAPMPVENPLPRRALSLMAAAGFFVAGLAGMNTEGCTPAQQATAGAVFNDIQTACQAAVLASSVIPAGSPVAPIAADIEIACDIAVTLDKDVQAVVAAYEAAEGDAGVTGPYKASPLVAVKRLTKAAKP